MTIRNQVVGFSRFFLPRVMWLNHHSADRGGHRYYMLCEPDGTFSRMNSKFDGAVTNLRCDQAHPILAERKHDLLWL
jgi:hypothetical protein